MNNFRLKYFKGFYLIMRDKSNKSEKYLFIPNEDFCCENFTFKKYGLELTTSAEFVLKYLLQTKRSRKDKNIWEAIDFNKNVCCFVNDGFIPYINESYLAVRDGNGDLVTSYPLAVFNLDEDFIGIASSKSDLLTLWNADSVNSAIGTLVDIGYDFIFKLNKN